MTAFGVVPRSLPIFDRKDYDDWIVKMEVILDFQELEEVVKIGFQDLTKLETDEQKKKSEKQLKENKKIDCKAQMLQHQCVSITIFQKISKDESEAYLGHTGTDLWKYRQGLEGEIAIAQKTI